MGDFEGTMMSTNALPGAFRIRVQRPAAIVSSAMITLL